MDLLQKLLPEYQNLLICGDFNIHINKFDDHQANSFVQSMEALGLYQHIDSATHNKGNTLYHLWVEHNSDLKIQSVTQVCSFHTTV